MVKNFLKVETSTKSGDPRNISPRTDVFLSVLGPFVAAFEQRMKLHPRLVKGLNSHQRENKMTDLLNYNRFVETDFSRFDMSMSFELLLLTEVWWIIEAFHGGLDYELMLDAMAAALMTTGVNECGITYEILGTRCSGDAHTSIGNGLINDFVTWLVVRDLDAVHYHEGDDGIIGVAEADEQQLLYNMQYVQCLGLQLKIDVYRDISMTSFCGRFLYEDRGVIKTYCDFYRTMAKLHTTCSDGSAKALLLAKSLSYLATDRHTPIVGRVCYSLMKLLMKEVSSRSLKRAKRAYMRDMYKAETLRFADDNSMKQLMWVFPNPSAECRANFALRTNISPAMQCVYESYYTRIFRSFIPSVIDRIPYKFDLDTDTALYVSVDQM